MGCHRTARGTLERDGEIDYADMIGGAPFKAKADWSQESLKTLVAAHEKTGLGVCELPKG